MSIRKVSGKQKKRIQDKQGHALQGAIAATVIANYGKKLEVLLPDQSILQVMKAQHIGSVVAGDIVGIFNNQVVGIHPRGSLLARPGLKDELIAVAANVTKIFITIAPIPRPSQTTIDRYLIAAEASKIEPIILLNKQDLLSGNIDAKLERLMQIYVNLGYTVIYNSNLSSNNYHELLNILHDNTSVFVGQSGVGKSSIINHFVELDVKVGALTTAQHGAHTTTTARLYPLEGGGAIIDSPGIREFPLWPMSTLELTNAFREFKEHASKCKFRNCSHIEQTNCGVDEAFRLGLISADRMQSFRLLFAQLIQDNI
jgi:ribosome biogenesis GTPase